MISRDDFRKQYGEALDKSKGNKKEQQVKKISSALDREMKRFLANPTSYEGKYMEAEVLLEEEMRDDVKAFLWRQGWNVWHETKRNGKYAYLIIERGSLETPAEAV